MDNFTTSTGLEVAIIGLAGRFPGAKNIDEFWHNLINGVESISLFSNEELLFEGIDQALLDNPDYVKAGSVLPDVEKFDAAFFGYTPREAEIMDPQHRLFLECAWQALENAGYNSQTYESPIGVFASGGMNSYLLNNLYSNRELLEASGTVSVIAANDKDHLSTLVSYKLNLTGPSVTIQTTCSSSLVAVHLACQSLLSGDCEMALAGGVSIPLPQKTGYLYQQGGILSPDGHCRAFDAKAQGMVVGAGAGIVVLKRLENALADGDRIYAVIKGSAINNDGSLKVGYTAPSVEGQAKVIQAAQVMAEVAAQTITYIETHGTATPLGDPIEIAALTQAFRTNTDEKEFCAIGSVKTNIGHLDTAAGVTGLIKTALALKHQMLPPSLNFEQPHPKIDFANSPFYVNTKLTEWKTSGTPRRAGVSSFGIGGTNAHVILEQAPDVETSETNRPSQLLLLSAKTNSALETMTANLAEYLQHHPNLHLADVAYTLQVGRRTHKHRRMLVCSHQEEAIVGLQTLEPKQVLTNSQELIERPVTFLFPGQGAQYVNMGKELYQVEPIFQDEVDRCAQLLQAHLGLDLRTVLYPTEDLALATQQLNQTYLTQPALFVIEYALAKLWMSWGIKPQAMIGHSIGEYVAACLAGVFSLEDALALVAARGQWMQQLPPGSMLAVPLSEKEIKPFLNQELSLATVNTPSMCVVAGTIEAVTTLYNQLASLGVECRPLHTSHAFHSAMMEPILLTFTELVKGLRLNSPQIPYISNVSGTWITDAEATDPSYWAKHLRQTVRFAQGVGELLQESDRLFLEVGPGRTLSTFILRHPSKTIEQVTLVSLRHPQDQQSDVAFLQNTLGQLWLAGVQIDWSGLYTHERRQRLSLPTYPFERQRYWVEAQTLKLAPVKEDIALHTKTEIADWFYIPSWKRSPVSMSVITSQKLNWLLFVDESSLSNQITQRLQAANQNVISVKVGKQFSKIGECSYTINPALSQDYASLLQELQTLKTLPQAIVHLWSLTPSVDMEPFAKMQILGFSSLLNLVQVIEEQKISEGLQIAVVSNQTQSVTDTESLYPEKATLLGVCKSLALQYPNLAFHHIDVVVPKSETRQEIQLVDHILNEITTKTSDLALAYRGNQRWIPNFEAIHLEHDTETNIALPENGVYLFINALSDVSLALVESFAQMRHAKIILTIDSTFPQKHEWHRILTTNSASDNVCQKIRRLQGLEALNSQVLILSAEATNEQHLRAVISKIVEIYETVNGVMYFTSSGENSIQELLALEKTLQESKTDLCLLISSLSSNSTGDIVADISADAFVQHHNQTNQTSWLKINWDTNISQKPEQIRNELSLEVLRRIISRPIANHVFVSTINLPDRLEQLHPNIAFAENQISYQVTEKQNSFYPRPNLTIPYIAPSNELEQQIANVWQKVFGFDQVGIDDNFFDLGGDSLLAVQVTADLKKLLNKEIPVVSLYECLTIRSVVELLNSNESEIEEMTVNIEEQKERINRRQQYQKHQRLNREKRDKV
ncbi:beta-ketoacyl synthase N-terminal-like domain-containing protein [uncultured Nostoc sp.]|uniref:type I polyketide synthase n=1 Tax=uncultured Nostoc sp. TaxID=340711 RepID=UPI0035C9A1FA